MKLCKPYVFLWIFACFWTGAVSQNLQVDDTYTAQQLVQDVLVDSPCANVSNFAVSGDPYSAGQQSYGYFTNTSPLFPFSQGVVLSTARAVRSEGPNNNLIDEGSGSWGGDQDLEDALISFIPNIHTLNATVLEFDFTPLTSQISFDYVFASEEYSGTAPCRYSDGFAFLLKPAGSNQPYQNLAVLPNSNTPVLVTTVHPAIGGSCPAINEEYFGSFNPPNYPVNFNGQTVVLTAKANVVPGMTYHIKLVIADDENIRYDSAIFLGGGSFQVGTDIGPDRLIATNNPVCVGQTHILDATEAGTNTYKWFKNGIELVGETNPTYTVVDGGVYSVEIDINSSGCIAKGKAIIEYTALPNLNDATLVQCDENNDGTTTFNLTHANSIVTNGEPSIQQVAYYPTLQDAQNEVNEIANPTAYQNASSNQVIARAENVFRCANFATVTLTISNNAISAKTIESCDNDSPQDGITGFALSSQITPEVLAGLPPGLIVSYYASANDALGAANPLPENFTNTIPNQQTIYALIENGPNCYGLVPVRLVVNAFDPADFDDQMVYLCNSNPETIGVANTFAATTWSSGQTTHSILVSAAGNYSVTVTDANGCSATKNFIVIDSQAATVSSVDVDDFAGNGNSLTVNITGNGDYEFSIDGFAWQDSPRFVGIEPGRYTVLVRDKHGCGTTPPELVYVMDYPKFFTPNGDGINDFWKIKNLNKRQQATIKIFDRYGKLLKHLDKNTEGWNGKYNGAELPSTDYWFTIEIENGRIVKGHFALKR